MEHRNTSGGVRLILRNIHLLAVLLPGLLFAQQPSGNSGAQGASPTAAAPAHNPARPCFRETPAQPRTSAPLVFCRTIEQRRLTSPSSPSQPSRNSPSRPKIHSTGHLTSLAGHSPVSPSSITAILRSDRVLKGMPSGMPQTRRSPLLSQGHGTHQKTHFLRGHARSDYEDGYGSDKLQFCRIHWQRKRSRSGKLVLSR